MGIKKFIQLFFYLLLYFLNIFFIFYSESKGSDRMRTLKVDFFRIQVSVTGTDTVQGTIYYWHPNKIFIDISFPLRQIIKVNSNEFLVYYPKTKEAVSIETNVSNSLPFFYSFLGAVRKDFDLENQGFSLLRVKTIKDTIISTWELSPSRKEITYFAIIKELGGRVSEARLEQENGKLVSEATFSKYLNFNEIEYPTEIITFTHSSMNMFEMVRFSNLLVEIPFPDSINNFSLPPDVYLKKKK